MTRLLGIAYEPRIRQPNQQRYSWEPVAAHRQLGQPLLPDARLDSERIARHWDEVLRLVVTLKLRYREAPAPVRPAQFLRPPAPALPGPERAGPTG